jgi:hypothetical protein
MTASSAQTLCQVGILVFAIGGALCVYGNSYFGRVAGNKPPRYVSRDPNTMQTPIYPRTKARVDERAKYLISQKIDPWLMMPTGKMQAITLHDGRTCRYSGVEYSGTPILVFWDALIDPFLEDEIRNVLDSIGKEFVANNIDAQVPLDEAAGLLRGMVRHVYDRMAYVDQALRREPTQQEKPPRKDVTYKVERMTQYVDEQVKAAKALFSKSEK